MTEEKTIKFHRSRPHMRIDIYLVSACPVKGEAYFTGAATSALAQFRLTLCWDDSFLKWQP